MLKQRLISSFFLWGSLIAVLYFFRIVGVVFLVALSSIFVQFEFSKLLKSNFCQLRFDILLSFTFILAYIWFARCFSEYVNLVYALALILICNRSVFVGKTAKAFLMSLFCFWYFTINLHFFLKILDFYEWQSVGLHVLIWVVLVTKLTDIGGFFVGCSIGRHQLAPDVSPKKTWEGVMGGFVFALVGGMIYYICCKDGMPRSFLWYKCVIFSIIMAWGSIVSDLLESLLKRQLDIKDSGRSIPGIGGVLDLIDSLLLNAPLGYILFRCFC